MRKSVTRLAVYLNSEFFQSLSNDCEWGTALESVSSESRALEVFETRVDALVLDPSFGQQAVGSGLMALARRNRVPIVCYSRLTPVTAHAILGAMRVHPVLLILADVDRPYSLIASRILAGRPSIATDVLSILAEYLEAAPSLMATSITNLFCTDAIRSVRGIARASAMSRRTLYRWCTKLGLAAPHDLVAAAKILRAYPVLKYSSSPIWVAAQAGGYRSQKTFSRHCLAFTGFAPIELRTSVEEQVVANRLGRALVVCQAMS